MRFQFLDESDLRTFHFLGLGAIGRGLKFVGKKAFGGAKFVAKTGLAIAGVPVGGGPQVLEDPTRPLRSLPIQQSIVAPSTLEGDTETSFLRRQLDRILGGGKDFIEGVVGSGATAAATSAESGGLTAKSGLTLDSNTLLIGGIAVVVLIFAMRR